MNTEVIRELKDIFSKILETAEEEMGDMKSRARLYKTINLFELKAVHELIDAMEEGLVVNKDYLSFMDKLNLERIATRLETSSYHELAVLGQGAGEILRNEIFGREP